MEKDELARLYVDYLTDGDESLLRVMAEDVYDHVSRQHGTAIWATVKNWIAESLSERRVEVHCVARDGDRVIIWMTVHARHVGSAFPWLQGRASTGRRGAWQQVHIFRLHQDAVVEHWAVRDDLRVLEAIDNNG